MTIRLFLENPYLRDIEAKLIDKTLIDDKFHLEFDRTIFCPNFNGHGLKDRGTINGYEVLDVYKKNSKIIHVLNEDIYTDNVNLNIDWDNRLDIIQQYTGKDLLTTGFYKLFNSKTLNYRITKDLSYLDVELIYFSIDDLKRVEIYINRIISLNFPINSHYIENKNPSSKIVEIENIDFSPSSTVHLRSTGEVGLLKIIKWEQLDNKFRIYFLAGNRALMDYDEKLSFFKSFHSLENTSTTDSNQITDLETEILNLKEKNLRLESKLFKPIIDDLEKNKQIFKNYTIVANLFEDENHLDFEYVFKHFSSFENTIQVYGFIKDNKSYYYILISEISSISLEDFDFTDHLFEDINLSNNMVFGQIQIDSIEIILNNIFNQIKNVLNN